MAINHGLRAKKAWPILVKLAIDGKDPITYGELCAKLGLHPRSASWFLGVIQAYCHKKPLPPLQALVVNKRSRLPGSGYDGSTRTRAAHKKALERVYSHGKRWPLKAPQFGT
jgi:hypothetical protein